MIGRAAFVIDRESLVVLSQQRVERQSHLFAGQGIATSLPVRPAGAAYPARARVNDALYLARGAQSAGTPGDRSAALDRARAELTMARSVRPVWGEIEIVAAFVHVLRDGEDTVATRRALEQSYAQTPYLRTAAAWRVQYGLRYWLALNPETRRRVINEAVWLTRIDDQSRTMVFDLARGSAAYKPFILRWLASRGGDADFGANNRITP
ncbi:hypothetical protein [Sphingomonas sp.]|uniref:hypothetical protein n=1 Tax=Sphingomonas sp. TaxID=28214 RepID=UPI0025F2B9D3|nr:hypothetical protein [Sphingomonas sp.]